MNKISICLLPLVALIFFCCKNESKELESLRQKMQNDSLLLTSVGAEMEEIDKAITEISAFTGSGEKTTPEKIKAIQDLITSSTDKIKELEEKVAKSNSTIRNNSVITKSLETQKKLIEEQQIEINALKEKIGVLEGEIGKKDIEIGGLKTVAGENAKTIAQAEARLRQLNSEINSAQMSKNNLDRQISQEYFAMARTLIELAEDNRGIFKNADNQRRDMTIKAYEYLCKLHKRGEYSALTEMTTLQSNKKLGKYLKGQSCR